MEPRASAAEVAWYRARVPADAGTCLELMCGYGRLLVPLAEAGLNLHGVDISPSMLAECETRLAATLFRQDIAELNLPFRYGAAWIAAGAFQSLSDSVRAREALMRIHAHLIEPASIAIDFDIPPESVQRIAAPLVEVRSAPMADGSRITLRSETTMHPDARLARTESRYVHRAGNACIAEEHETRETTWYSRDDAAALLAEAGYRDVRIERSPRDGGAGETFAIIARG